MKRIGVVFFAGIFLFSAPFRAEEIQLKDGNKVTGKVVGVTDDVFQIKTAYGNIQVPRAEILSIGFPENQPKNAKDASTGATPVDETLLGVTYTNRTANFQLTVPKGWVTSDSIRGQNKDIVAALTSPDQTLIFMVTPEKFSGTLATYEVLAETQYQTRFKDYEKISENEILLDGRTGVRMIWRGKNTMAHDTPLKAVVYFVPYDGRMVRLSFLTLEPLFAESLPVFEKIASSYHTHASTPLKTAGGEDLEPAPGVR
jgi:hypothetical protein